MSEDQDSDEVNAMRALQEEAAGEVFVPDTNRPVESCDINTLGRLQKENPDGFLLLVSKRGCGGCEEVEALVAESVGEKKPLIVADVIEDPSCDTLADQIGAGVTPTLIYYEGGKEVKRLVPDGVLTPDDFRRELKAIAARPVPAMAAATSA